MLTSIFLSYTSPYRRRSNYRSAGNRHKRIYKNVQFPDEPPRAGMMMLVMTGLVKTIARALMPRIRPRDGTNPSRWKGVNNAVDEGVVSSTIPVLCFPTLLPLLRLFLLFALFLVSLLRRLPPTPSVTFLTSFRVSHLGRIPGAAFIQYTRVPPPPPDSYPIAL